MEDGRTATGEPFDGRETGRSGGLDCAGVPRRDGVVATECEDVGGLVDPHGFGEGAGTDGSHDRIGDPGVVSGHLTMSAREENRRTHGRHRTPPTRLRLPRAPGHMPVR